MIVFEDHCVINPKSFSSAFNYQKCHIIINFVKCIQDYGSAINNNIATCKVIY